MTPRPLLLAAVLAGCGPVQSIDDAFDTLKGQTVAAAEAKLGAPANLEEGPNGAVMVWTASVRDDTPVSTEKTLYDYGRANTVEVVERPAVPPLTYCSLTVRANAAGTIVAVVRDGPSPACAPLARLAVATRA